MSREKLEFWEASFKDKQSMWGFKPADSAMPLYTYWMNKNENG
ncbi:hypothetical protein [Catenovulum sediminis]|uniref:Uncharacterized protein n=1 Tax=Catenovulum sediminis TaxID=1740262 RepID=A0ABV1RE51_9ALTE|nr:hypothetical protein [Catenovulum sediminis]